MLYAGIFVYAYTFYYYLARSDMSGFMQVRCVALHLASSSLSDSKMAKLARLEQRVLTQPCCCHAGVVLFRLHVCRVLRFLPDARRCRIPSIAHVRAAHLPGDQVRVRDLDQALFGRKLSSQQARRAAMAISRSAADVSWAVWSLSERPTAASMLQSMLTLCPPREEQFAQKKLVLYQQQVELLCALVRQHRRCTVAYSFPCGLLGPARQRGRHQ